MGASPVTIPTSLSHNEGDNKKYMKTITRNINRFDEWSNSWFTDPVTEYVLVNNIYQWIADKLPKKLVYFCYIRFMAYATTHGEGEFMQPDEMTFSKATEIWESHNY